MILSIFASIILAFKGSGLEDQKADNSSDEPKEEVGKHFLLVFTILVGPSSICGYITLLISRRKSYVTEIIAPVESLVAMISYVVMFESEIFPAIDLAQVWISSQQIFLTHTILSLLFLTATWHISFPLRTTAQLGIWFCTYIVRREQVAVQ